MDRSGVRQAPEGSGEQRKMEETACEIICDAPMTFLLKGQVEVKEGDDVNVCYCVTP